MEEMLKSEEIDAVSVATPDPYHKDPVMTAIRLSLIHILLKAKSFEVIDIGVDVCAEKFVEAVKTYQPDVLCMSSLLTTSMGYFKVVLDALQEAGVRDCVKVAICLLYTSRCV